MKKILFFMVLLPLAASSFAQDNTRNRYIFIEGTANRQDHLEFFMTNFTMEAGSAGYIVTESKSEAAHTFKFSVSPIDAAKQPSQADDNQFVINISLLSNTDDFEILAFDFFFTALEEMYLYNRVLFQNATLYIPPITEEDLILAGEIDRRWQNKWLYVRASFDYPITFYILKQDGLVGGIGLYSGEFEDPDRTAPIGHEIMAMPGGTVGVEFQFLNFMSFEANFQFSMGDTRDNFFFNMAAGAELKVPIKFENIILVPYGMGVYYFMPSPIFKEFPLYAVGGGIQVCAKGGKHGAFFVDVKYMFSFSDAVMKNPYLGFPADNQFYPSPEVIHYNRSVIGLGIGYKIGFFDRKGKPRR